MLAGAVNCASLITPCANALNASATRPYACALARRVLQLKLGSGSFFFVLDEERVHYTMEIAKFDLLV